MKRYVMIGAPVTAVRTPPLLEAFLAGLGIANTVEARHLDAAGLDAFMAAVRVDHSIDGLMVTMPHKKAIIPHLAAISAVAARAGSVNAVKRLETGDLVGAQFDGIALVNALLAKGAPLGHARILLAGVGGAGLAIAQALVAYGCAGLVIAERDEALRARTVGDLARLGRCPVTIWNGDPGAGFDVLINATPLGMRDGDPSPFEPALVADTPWIADIVADPPRTRLAALAVESGSVLVSGRDMVIGQVEPIGRWLLTPGVEQDEPCRVPAGSTD